MLPFDACPLLLREFASSKVVIALELDTVNGDCWLGSCCVWNWLEQDFCFPRTDCQSKQFSRICEAVDNDLKVALLVYHEGIVICKHCLMDEFI
ncbi:hypothetical protein RRG08_044331 [Elysia crispata]|uniref:Uncharacterized protein n=1 Tax=Elysia crispata TaxID=231223 RepID=A0AAE1A968_9GAST|nr:hypothetical protein RRG08_044331 [Elysia crispata]